MSKCKYVGCDKEVSKEGYDFCYTHWKLWRAGKLVQLQDGSWADKDKAPVIEQASGNTQHGKPLTATKLAEHFQTSATKLNLILAELGWIEKFTKGWKLTEHGEQRGGQQKEVKKSGVPYVAWDQRILDNEVLAESVRMALGRDELVVPGTESVPVQEEPDETGFVSYRPTAAGKYRTVDGHYVRSRAEVMIDNWLYMQNIMHAYERRLPIDEEVYCDFYLPQGKVYIEFWGMSNRPDYEARKAEKQALYAKYDYNLINLNNDDVNLLDDVLSKMLLKYGIDCS